MNENFRKFAHKTSEITGSSWAFLTAALIIVLWMVTGPLFHYSDTWQLVINTGTTIITFLMVFLIQNTQNRDAAAIHLKLDELIRSTNQARDSLIDVEHLSDQDLKRLQESFRQLRQSQPNIALDDIRTVEEELEERAEEMQQRAKR